MPGPQTNLNVTPSSPPAPRAVMTPSQFHTVTGSGEQFEDGEPEQEQERTQTDHSARSKIEESYCKVGEYINWIGNHHEDGLVPGPGLLEILHERREERHIAVDEIEPGLVRFATCPRGDNNHVRL